MTITIAEWQAAFDAARSRGAGDDGATARELADARGVAVERMQEDLRSLHRAGRLIAGRAPRDSITGDSRMVPVYRLKPEA